MIIRFSMLAIGLFVLFYISGGERMAGAQQDASKMMSLVNGPANTQATNIPKDVLVDRLDLKAYEAVMGDKSLCGDNKDCQEDVRDIKIWRCISAVCSGKDKAREPISCFGDATKGKSEEILNKINAAICPYVKSPGPDTRKVFLKSIAGVSNATADDLVGDFAHSVALQGAAKLCEKYIKDYVGAYGPRWNHHWYRALSGCRILAGESTRVQEEKDFYTWFGVVQGSGKCSDIVNSEMRNACSAPGAGSPVPGNGY